MSVGVFAAAVAAGGPPKPKKEPQFPVKLFTSATSDDYVDERACARCHREAAATFQQSPHAGYVSNPNLPIDRQGCQSCHGPGGPHVAHRDAADKPYDYIISYTHAKPMEIAQACLRCHNDTITEAHWRRSGHARANVTCTDCHQMHAHDRLAVDKDPVSGRNARFASTPVFPAAPEPKALLKADEPTLCGRCHPSAVNEFRHNFHHPVPEGRLVCSDCHDAHPNRDERKRFRTNKQNCITCHPQVAGPFAFEHDPVSDLSGNGCLECHKPHGSPNASLLNATSRGLCLQCHSDKAVNHFPGRTCWQAGCHASPHGSNHSQFFFQP
jgi:predicted CXXCH cytochrome family protein